MDAGEEDWLKLVLFVVGKTLWTMVCICIAAGRSMAFILLKRRD